MSRAQKALGTCSMFLLILAILITSFQAAIYGDPQYGFYETEYEKYQVTEALGMEMRDVMEVTDHMMAYLIGAEEELSIVTHVDGEEQDFFNEQDRIHMADVTNLFLGGLRARTVCLILAAILLVILAVRKADLKRFLPGCYFRAFGIFLAAVLFLAIAFAIDFTKCFTIFHEIFFTNDLWIFDPATDYMIRMLPEGFFADMVARIGLFFLGALAELFVIFFLWYRSVRKKDQIHCADERKHVIM